MEAARYPHGGSAKIRPMVSAVKRRLHVALSPWIYRYPEPQLQADRLYLYLDTLYTGFRETLNDLVIFIEDDLRTSPGLIKGHICAHRVNPGAVIFGQCRPSDSGKTDAIRFVESLESPVRAAFRIHVSPHQQSECIALSSSRRGRCRCLCGSF